jgi:hypothetical protein
MQAGDHGTEEVFEMEIRQSIRSFSERIIAVGLALLAVLALALVVLPK